MFRNIPLFIPSEVDCASLCEIVSDKVVSYNAFKNLPSSNDYSLSDLLAAGVAVSPVDPTILHDSSTANSVADTFIDNYVVPSNNDVK